eukprot:scaffold285613_cov32-Tisochrysis_lutea.AAC.4
MVRAIAGPLDAALEQEVAKKDALPNRGGHARSAPTESDRLFGQVLFLPAVASADERDGEGGGCINEAGNVEPVRRPLDLRDCAVIAHVVERGRREEAVLHQLRQRGLNIERVAAREADEIGMAGDPLIGRALVLWVDRGDRRLAV